MKSNNKKTTVKKRSIKKQKTESFIETLLSVRYRGTLWRSAVFTAIAITVTIINMVMVHLDFMNSSYAGIAGWTSPLAVPYTYESALRGIPLSLAAFVVYDGLFVAVSHRYRIKDSIDRVLLLGMEAAFFIVAYIGIMLAWFINLSDSMIQEIDASLFWIVLVAATILVLRAFVGVSLYVSSKNK